MNFFIKNCFVRLGFLYCLLPGLQGCQGAQNRTSQLDNPSRQIASGCVVIENGEEHPMDCDYARNYLRSNPGKDFCIIYAPGQEGTGACSRDKIQRRGARQRSVPQQSVPQECLVVENGKDHPMGCDAARNYFRSNPGKDFCIIYARGHEGIGACGSEDPLPEGPYTAQ